MIRVMAGMLRTVVYSFRVFICSVWGKVSIPVLGYERQRAYEVIPRLGLGVVAICGGYFMQTVLFDFREIFVLERSYKTFLLLVVVGGVLLMFLYGVRGFKRLKCGYEVGKV